MAMTIPTGTVEQDPRVAEAESRLAKLSARWAEIEARQRAIVRELESGQASAAEIEVASVLRDDGRRDPQLAKLHARLKALDEERAELERVEAVIRKAVSDQRAVVQRLGEEALRPAVAAALGRWDELLAELVAFGEQATAIGQGFARASAALDRPMQREDSGWFPTPHELARMQERTEHVRTVLRAGAFDV